MLVLFFGIAAIVGTVVLGARSGESCLRYWEGLGEIQEDHREIHGQVDPAPRPVAATEKERAPWSSRQAFEGCVAP
ncbi:MAG: hypothetical protein A2Y76_09815 [Planctomycetes bacterium RBG_13_60_9]|nr:MAG: hypothetical protein A2Y76_09815 [Planctomycetes bacterium RBG_13_60_9]